MKRVKLYKEFILNNQKGDIITIDNIIDCIKNDGCVYAKIVKNFPENNPENPLKPLSVDNDGLITVDFNGDEYEVSIKNITKVE